MFEKGRRLALAAAVCWELAAAAGVIDVGKLPRGPQGPIFVSRGVGSKPSDISPVTAADFAIRPERVAKLGDTIFGRGELMRKLADYLLNTPSGRRYWGTLAERAAASVNRWSLGVPTRADRHVYIVSQFGTYGMIYALSGNAGYGRLLKAYLFDALALPMEFWVHAELRGYDPAKPQGMLESGHMARALAEFMSVAGDELFTPAEKSRIDAALRVKSLAPLRNWIDANDQAVHNFVANISSSCLMMATYLGDRTVRDMAFRRLKRYMSGSFEDDGSYGEGHGYFGYAFGVSTVAWQCLTSAERAEILRGCSFGKASRWLASQYFYNTGKKGELLPWQMAFCDAGYHSAPNGKMLLKLRNWFDDPLAVWLSRTFQVGDGSTDLGSSLEMIIDNLDLGGPKAVAPKSPMELNLPLLAIFSNGETHLRSSWRSDSVVVGMKRSAFPRTGFAHNRPESNSIVLAGKGEYFIVTPGVASYRSVVSKKYDKHTVSANVVMLDNKNQLKAEAERQAFILAKQETPEYLMAAQESAPVVPGAAHAVRAVVFFKASQAVVVFDAVVADDPGKKHKMRLGWHFYNRDGKSRIENRGGGKFFLNRPRAGLAFSVYSDRKLVFSEEPGYLHYRGGYMPGGPGEGKAGSALVHVSRTNSGSATLVSVFQAVAPGDPVLETAWRDGVLTLGPHRLSLKNGGLTIDGKTFKLFVPDKQ